MNTVQVAPKTYCVRVDLEGTNRLLWPQFHVMSDGTCHVMSMSGFKYLTTCANLDAAIDKRSTLDAAYCGDCNAALPAHYPDCLRVS